MYAFLKCLKNSKSLDQHLSKLMASTSIASFSRVGTSQNWAELPPELTTSILTRVGSVDLLLSARKVCKTWRKICSGPDVWKVVDIRYSEIFYKLFNELGFDYVSKMEELVKQVVNLSSGQMIDFTIEGFGSDNMLRYISDRSCQLRRLRLLSCHRITEEGLSEMVKKLPLLEELHLCYIPVSKQAIEVIGRCCPLLKSFSFNRLKFTYPTGAFNEEALAIAENMPGLRQVQLIGNQMTSLGLLAIVENCVHLESLDMRQCFNVGDLEYNLERQLSQKIKNIRFPYDSTKDYEFGAEICDSSEDDPFGLSYFECSDIDSDN